jgi:hypothetical protein
LIGTVVDYSKYIIKILSGEKLFTFNLEDISNIRIGKQVEFDEKGLID